MNTGVTVTNSAHVRFIDWKIGNMDKGFDISDSEDISLEKVQCQSTRVAVVGERVKRLHAVDVTHHPATNWYPQPTLLAVLIRRASYGHV
jgi:hypothetical protein